MSNPSGKSRNGSGAKGSEVLDPFPIAAALLKDMLPNHPGLLNQALGMVRARDIPSLASLGEIPDIEYQSGTLWPHLALRQVASLFKKNDAFADDTTCTRKAEENFFLGERRCRIANKRLDHFYSNPERMPGELKTWLNRMEFDIKRLLGSPEGFVNSIPELVRLTNGATEDRSRKRSYPFLKLTGKLRAPAGAKPWLQSLCRFYGIDFDSCRMTFVDWNTITLVLKNWKTHRTIAKESTHALPFQLALDSWLKKLLKRWGVDLRSQKTNQELAREGSLTGELATIDLEMASDTLAYNCVAWMLPSEWLRIFDSFRSRSFNAPWGTGDYAKYSSMGNGYTFTLETLIFTAACRAIGSRRYSVYGDDLIVESELVPQLVQLLGFLGFRVNKEKSYSDPNTRFRESCGCDYYKGELVTPFYLRELPKLEDRSGMSHALNGLVACAPPQGHPWNLLAKFVKDHHYCLVPGNKYTRSGVFITPRAAWVAKKLTTDQRRKRRGKDNPNFGFPIFDGYGPRQQPRKVAGRRSLLLWFLNRNYGGERAVRRVANRGSQLMLDTRQLLNDSDNTAMVTSEVSQGCRYVHCTRRYDPKPSMTPSHLFLLDEILMGGTAA